MSRLVFQVPVRDKGYCQVFLPDCPLTARELDWLLKGLTMVWGNLRDYEPYWSDYGLPVAGTKNLAASKEGHDEH